MQLSQALKIVQHDMNSKVKAKDDIAELIKEDDSSITTTN